MVSVVACLKLLSSKLALEDQDCISQSGCPIGYLKHLLFLWHLRNVGRRRNSFDDDDNYNGNNNYYFIALSKPRFIVPGQFYRLFLYRMA